MMLSATPTRKRTKCRPKRKQGADVKTEGADAKTRGQCENRGANVKTEEADENARSKSNVKKVIINRAS